MAISNIASNLRPGVVTSTTRPASPYEGQVIYETDTNRVLVWDASAWVMIADVDTPPAMKLMRPSGVTNGTLSGATVTIGSAVSSVVVSGVFNSDFDNYFITYEGISFSIGAGGSSFFLKFNNSTGSTYEYGGHWRQITAAGFAGTQATAVNFGVWVGLTGANAAHSFGKITVFSPNKASRTSVLAETGNNTYIMTGGGADTNAVAQTGFEFFLPTGSGAMTGGTIRVYGYRN